MLEKCSVCSKDYPTPTLKVMVHIVERKAYIKKICPNCQSIVLNNPNYYYLVEEKQSGA
ncbi:MAG: hypothetical protein ACOX0F_00075 [Syntrophomonadaceae bacterium]|jgi:hypothetical protein